MAQRVLLLLPTNTYRAGDFLAAAERLGVDAVVGSERRQALQDIAPGRTLTLTLHRPETAVRQILEFAARRSRSVWGRKSRKSTRPAECPRKTGLSVLTKP